MPRARSIVTAWLCAALSLASAQPLRAAERETLRVGTSGDYPPWSEKQPAPEDARKADENELYSGFDIEVARAFAAARGLELRFVTFRWPKLLDELAANRFDVAMGGITVRPERSLAGRFSAPVAETGVVLLAPSESSLRGEDDVERLSNIRIAVNAGGYLEQFAKERFPNATSLAIGNNAAVLDVLLARGAEVALTDTSEAALWIARAKQKSGDNLREIGPLSRDRKAYLFGKRAGGRAADFDAWLAEREASGWLTKLRRRKLGEGEEVVALATPLPALFAAIDERLALMPIVGTAKRREGFPIEVPEREAEVIEAAVAQVRDAARAAKRPEPDANVTSALRALFRAQFDAAKQIQLAALRDSVIPDETELPDVERVLRPALDRISEKVARQIAVLPDDLTADAIRNSAVRELRSELLSDAARDRIAESVLILAMNQRASARAAMPAAKGSATQTP
jgi:cyclohexadienyl dehydratase